MTLQSTTMTYGAYTFDPVPIINITRRAVQADNKLNPFNFPFTMTLNGVLVADPNGLDSLWTLMENLRSGLNQDGKYLTILCGVTEIFKERAWINDITFNESNNNWIDTIPYTIEIEYDESADNPSGDIAKIESYEETWDVEFLNETKRYFIWDTADNTNIPTSKQDGSSTYTEDQNNPFECKIVHNVTCQGRRSWTGVAEPGTLKEAAENAWDFITTVGVGSDLGYDATNTDDGKMWGHAIQPFFNLSNNTADFIVLDNFRSSNVNESNGTASATELFYIIGANTGLAAIERNITEDFSVDIRQGIDQNNVNVSIQGTIQGLQVNDYSTTGLKTNTATSAYDNAASGWTEIQDRLFPRAQFVYFKDYTNNLNPSPASKQVSHSPSQGTISYSYEFNDRPCSFFTNVLSENVTIVDNNPTDVFATLQVLGRGRGPVLQAIDTVTAPSRDVTVELVVPPPTACSSYTDLEAFNPGTQVETFICNYETALTTANDQVFKTNDIINWNPINGRYSRSVSWTYQDCGTDYDTTIC